MVMTLDDTKRTAIAGKLANMKAVQNLLIANEQKLLSTCEDEDIRDHLEDMLEDDRKNLGILDTVIVQYGVKAEPEETVATMLEQVQKLMQSSDLSLYEKASKHELLKHQQFMNGVLIHKAAQIVGTDIESAIKPLNVVNFENRAHQEQMKGILEVLGVEEMTGQRAEQGLWARVQDAVAAMTGVVGSAASRMEDELDLQDIIRLDHHKASKLFKQIERADDPNKVQEYFGQLYKDLSVHAEAEEQVVYPAVSSFYKNTQELYDEQAAMKQALEKLRSLNPATAEFKSEVQALQQAVTQHVQQEEREMFAKIRENLSDDQRKALATEFKTAKSQLQDQLAAKLHQ
ncbi:MAG: hemerythrin domain-containing protein [Microcoleaceae cyanobacterium]